MRILQLGQNPENTKIAGRLGGPGREVVVLDSLENVRALEGQAGGFSLAMNDGTSVAGDFVVLTQQPAGAVPPVDGGQMRALLETGKDAFLKGGPHKTPVVFLLDYFCESPFAATARALRDARELAANKRPVYYAARFVRTAGRDAEAAYAAARAAGVTFIKYTDIDFTYDKRTDRFDVRAADGVLDYLVQGAVVFADGGCEVGKAFEAAAKKLRLHADERGYLLEDRHFLTPALTSRRGVFQIGRDVQAECLDDALDFIAAEIGAFAPGRQAETKQAVVDGERCVLCYNCFRACPHAALRADAEARKMQAMPEACQGCGSCVAVCPGDAITLGERKARAPQSGKLLVLACENGAALALPGILPGLDGLSLETRALPCGGDVGLEDMTGALLAYDKVLVAVCPDDACKHFDGNRRAKRQAERLAGMMDAAGLEAGRVRVVQASHAMPGVLRDEILSFARGEETT